MKELSTVIAVGGVVAIAIGTLIYYGISGITLDPEVMKLYATGLMGFAAGGATKVLIDSGKNE
jgi:hypothetical protein